MPRRLASTVTALFLVLQFVLLGSGFMCVTPGGDEGGMADMAPMGVGLDRASATAPAPGDGHEDCSVPWMPVGCQAMAPCAPAAVASIMTSRLPSPSFVSELEQLTVLAPTSLSTPPDLPPPRA